MLKLLQDWSTGQLATSVPSSARLQAHYHKVPAASAVHNIYKLLRLRGYHAAGRRPNVEVNVDVGTSMHLRTPYMGQPLRTLWWVGASTPMSPQLLTGSWRQN